MNSTHPADRPESAVSEAAAQELREEIERLVQIVARKPSLSVHEGHPGCSWAFNWDINVVVVDPEDLRFLSGDLCRGLAVHEASHARITVLHRILARKTLSTYMPLLNCVEDLRIDTWSASRWPGSAPWLASYNRVVQGLLRQQGAPRSRQAQFLLGVLERGYFGTTVEGLLPDVVAGLDACRGAIEAAVACQPPPGDDPLGILASQRAMWAIVRTGLLPTWNVLVRKDNENGIGPLAKRELEAFVRAVGGEHEPGRRSGTRGTPLGALHRRLPRVSRTAASASPGPSGGSRKPRVEATEASKTHLDRYEAAWKRVAPIADRLGDELLRVIVPKRRMGWSNGHHSGPRLLTRRAMQFDADPRDYALFSRPLLPERRDPAVMLLVDRSGSMSSNHLSDRALEGTVLLTEVCRRIGVPAAVWSFSTGTEEELGWDDPLDAAARCQIGSLPSRSDGTTDMTTALVTVGQAFAAQHGDPKILFVIGDGAPDNHDATVAAAARLDREGLVTVGLGLGSGTKPLARYFQRSVVDIAPERLVDQLAVLLGVAIAKKTCSAARHAGQ